MREWKWERSSGREQRRNRRSLLGMYYTQSKGYGEMFFWHPVKIFIYEFFTLMVLFSSVSRGIDDICRLCCHIQGQEHSLNCSWNSLSDTEHTLYLQHLKNDLSVLNFTAPLGQNWLLIHREYLVMFDPYHLRLTAGGKEVQLNITFQTNGENVLLQPPILTPVEYEDHNIVVVKWEHQEHVSAEQEQALQYRKVGAANWTEVHNDLLEPNSYDLTNLDLYVEYEVQIRYLPKRSSNEKGSRWSKTLTFCTPGEVPCGLLDVWRSSVEGPTLRVQWKPLSNRTERDKILVYNVTYVHGGQTNTTEVQSCHIQLPSEATNICVSPKNQHGLGYVSCTPPSCSDLTPASGIKVWVDRSGGIKVSVREMLPAPEDPHTYLVECKELIEAGNTFLNWTRFPTTNQNLTLSGDFAPYVPYEVTVFVLYNNRCAGVASSVLYSQEGAPSAGPNVSIHLISADEAHLSWDELPLPHRRGNITSYTIYLNSTEHSLQQSVLGRNNCISGLLPNTAYTVRMTAWTGAGEGPPGCARKFRTGHITYQLVVIGVIFLLITIPLSLCTIWVVRRWIWTRIPNIETNQELIQNNFNWGLEQEDPNTPITIVEEIEPPQQAPKPPEKIITSGYEKHFLPTPEEVMGLR
ncbi:interleukin-27 receptor subunit alpha isoform X2 [Xenopus laevis]|uniref:Interleukin-27 receptor subunit alpha isoform X2 n=1 Tax=Xenopus laevis TaxID=8355 RepID=A0A8J0UTL6_XENLA|nr:interleukin-27 receptor subunit alpha isoform X2 [Xenopus laevis]